MAAIDDDILRRTLDALAAAAGNVTATAETLGVNRSTVYNHLTRAAQRGLDGSVPRPVPPGQVIKGVSTLFDRTGAVAMTWVKTRTDLGADRESWLDAVREALAEYRGLIAPVAAPADFDPEALVLHGFADLHFGLYAWAAETGAAYDLDIADRLLAEATGAIVAQTPPADTAVALFLGDTTHADNSLARTPASGHALDVDTRHQKVKLTAARAMLRVVDMLRQRHRRVIVRVLPGNHDPETAGALAIALALYFEREPRVTVDLDPGLFWFMTWGRVLIGATHGHTVRMEDLPGVMAALCPAAWGATDFRRFYSAHIHHRQGVEKFGVRVESLNTIAARDAYNAGRGHLADRMLTAFRFHKQRGPLGSIEVAVAPGGNGLAGL